MHLGGLKRQIQETPEERAEQEQIVKSAVPSQSNWREHGVSAKPKDPHSDTITGQMNP